MSHQVTKKKLYAHHFFYKHTIYRRGNSHSLLSSTLLQIRMTMDTRELVFRYPYPTHYPLNKKLDIHKLYNGFWLSIIYYYLLLNKK